MKDRDAWEGCSDVDLWYFTALLIKDSKRKMRRDRAKVKRGRSMREERGSGEKDRMFWGFEYLRLSRGGLREIFGGSALADAPAGKAGQGVQDY